VDNVSRQAERPPGNTGLAPQGVKYVIPIVIVPNSLNAAINEKLDAAIAGCPGAEKDREILYGQLLDYFNEYGVIPDFTIKAPAAGVSP
jgi:hypothetical protein